jgi:hypothetical protein
MPARIPTHRPPRLKSSMSADACRPNAYRMGYTDKRHRAWRLAVLTRDSWQCRACGRICSSKAEAHADHVSPVVHGTEHCRDGRSRYDVTAGQCLCHSCHSQKTRAENR